MQIIRTLVVCLLTAGFFKTASCVENLSLAATRCDWEAHRQFFKENGYLWIKDFFSEEQVQLLKSWAEEINNASQNLLFLSKSSGICLQALAKNLPGSLIVVPEASDPNLVCRAEDLSSCYPGLFHFVTGTATQYIGRLLGEPYILYKDKINFKWPGGGAFRPHQDYPAYELLGAREHVTAMISIDPATLENGCLHVAKRWKETFAADFDSETIESGKIVLPFVSGGSAHGAIHPDFSDKITWIALETSPRDLVIFDSFIPHYSELNQSAYPRRAMFFTHNRVAEGDFLGAYYRAKREDPDNPIFHIGTPTKAKTKE